MLRGVRSAPGVPRALARASAQQERESKVHLKTGLWDPVERQGLVLLAVAIANVVLTHGTAMRLVQLHPVHEEGIM